MPGWRREREQEPERVLKNKSEVKEGMSERRPTGQTKRRPSTGRTSVMYRGMSWMRVADTGGAMGAVVGPATQATAQVHRPIINTAQTAWEMGEQCANQLVP